MCLLEMTTLTPRPHHMGDSDEWLVLDGFGVRRGFGEAVRSVFVRLALDPAFAALGRFDEVRFFCEDFLHSYLVSWRMVRARAMTRCSAVAQATTAMPLHVAGMPTASSLKSSTTLTRCWP